MAQERRNYVFPQVGDDFATIATRELPGVGSSLSLAPLRTEQRDAFSRMFRLIEEMPEAAFDS